MHRLATAPRIATLATLATLLVTVSAAEPRSPLRHPQLRQTQSAASLAPAVGRAPDDLAPPTGVAAGRLGAPLAAAASARARIAAGAPGTYIHDLLAGHDSSLARWPDRRRDPLRVWVQPTAAIPHWRPAFAARVREAFRDWEALGIPVRVAFTGDSARADVHVTWTDRFGEPISGKTVWARDDDWWIVGGDITLAVHHSAGAPLDSAAVKAIALHEVGHLLGLDHTADSATIMAPRVRVRELAPADRATMRLLYTLPAGRVR